MKVFAISDLHISRTSDKPMAVFGGNWIGYLDKIKADWEKKVSEEDLVLIGGDISWAMDLGEALYDMEEFTPLKGKKILIRGNHDYWWKSISRLREGLAENVYALQNDAVKFGNVTSAARAGGAFRALPIFRKRMKNCISGRRSGSACLFWRPERIREEGDKLVVLIHYPPFNVKRESSLFTDLFERAGRRCGRLRAPSRQRRARRSAGFSATA